MKFLHIKHVPLELFSLGQKVYYTPTFCILSVPTLQHGFIIEISRRIYPIVIDVNWKGMIAGGSYVGKHSQITNLNIGFDLDQTKCKKLHAIYRGLYE